MIIYRTYKTRLEARCTTTGLMTSTVLTDEYYIKTRRKTRDRLIKMIKVNERTEN